MFNGWKIDFFPYNPDAEEVSIKEVFGALLSVAHPKSAIEAKKRYVESRFDVLSEGQPLSAHSLSSLFKHIEDIQRYNEWLYEQASDIIFCIGDDSKMT